MPTADEYAAGYDLKEGLTLAKYQLTYLNIEHKQIVRWNEYSYPTTLVFIWTGTAKPSIDDMNNLFTMFTDYIAGLHVIYTAKGTPYKCLFQFPLDVEPTAHYNTDYTEITLRYTGYGKRIGRKEAEAITSGKQIDWDKLL